MTSTVHHLSCGSCQCLCHIHDNRWRHSAHRPHNRCGSLRRVVRSLCNSLEHYDVIVAGRYAYAYEAYASRICTGYSNDFNGTDRDEKRAGKTDPVTAWITCLSLTLKLSALSLTLPSVSQTHNSNVSVNSRRQSTQAINKSKRNGYCSPDLPDFNNLCTSMKVDLFNKVLKIPIHVLHPLLPPPVSHTQRYGLWPRVHDRTLNREKLKPCGL